MDRDVLSLISSPLGWADDARPASSGTRGSGTSPVAHPKVDHWSVRNLLAPERRRAQGVAPPPYADDVAFSASIPAVPVRQCHCKGVWAATHG